MQWFTGDLADYGSEEDVALAIRSYEGHLAKIEPILPADLRRLARDPALSLLDGRIRSFNYDTATRQLRIAIEIGDQSSGYSELVAMFQGAELIPQDFQRLRYALVAEFREDKWKTVSEVVDEEIDTAPNHRLVIRLRLFPFYEFAVQFSSIEIDVRPITRRRAARASRFIVRNEYSDDAS